MNETGRDDLLRGVLPAALEVMTAWDLAEGTPEEPGDTSEFVAAMDRVIGDVAGAEQPRLALARLLFAQVSLSGILLEEVSRLGGVSRRDVLQAVHREHVDETPRS
jgi:ABC-type transport system involved in cytochrome bd biosynthesis fused ATPase/permease subunit